MTQKSSRFPVPSWALFRIAERDGWKCHVCKLGYLANDPWTIDHDVALANGGTNHIKNLRLSHGSCNREKSAA